MKNHSTTSSHAIYRFTTKVNLPSSQYH